FELLKETPSVPFDCPRKASHADIAGQSAAFRGRRSPEGGGTWERVAQRRAAIHVRLRSLDSGATRRNSLKSQSRGARSNNCRQPRPTTQTAPCTANPRGRFQLRSRREDAARAVR